MRQVFPEQQPYFGFVREELLLLMNLLHLKHVHISTNTRPKENKISANYWNFRHVRAAKRSLADCRKRPR